MDVHELTPTVINDYQKDVLCPRCQVWFSVDAPQRELTCPSCAESFARDQARIVTAGASRPPNESASFGKQLSVVLIAAGIVVMLVDFDLNVLSGLIVYLTGLFAFLDAWHAGIRKDPTKRSFLNLSPMAWGILMVLFLIPVYPIYFFSRNRLKTSEGNRAYWITTNVLGSTVIAFLAILALVILFAVVASGL